MTKICWLSDFAMEGNGYLNISVPLCDGLAKAGHDVKAIGFGYNGEEHFYDFSILPAKNFQEIITIIQNLWLANKWKFDIFVCALDIPHQERLLSVLADMGVQTGMKFPYIGIMPVEAGPLCFSWAMVMQMMDKVFIISEYGTEEAKKVGIDAEHLQIGIDTDAWKYKTAEARAEFRENMGLTEDDFVVLTVAENQERKNLHRAMETFAEFAKDKDNARYMMVTRKFSLVGGKLDDYVQELGFTNKFIYFERGLSFEKLWSLYAGSDVFLLPSKAEGLGMILLEAMAVGVPCVATDCTAIKEVLADGRGILVPYDYTHRDCFGNGFRFWFNRDAGVSALNEIYENGWPTLPARKYVEGRTHQISLEQMERAISSLVKEEANGEEK